MKDDRNHYMIDLEHRRPMSRENACELLGVTLRTLQRRMKSGDVERVEVPGKPDHVRIKPTKWSLGKLAKRQVSDTANHVATPEATNDDMSRHVATLASRLDALELQFAESPEADELEGEPDHEQYRGGETSPTGWRLWCAFVLMRIKVWCDALLARLRA